MEGVDGGSDTGAARGEPVRGACIGGSGPSAGAGEGGGEDGMGSGHVGTPGLGAAPCR